MKKTFIFGLMAAALGFTACCSEDDLNVNDNNQKKDKVLRVTVEQTAESCATFTDNEGVWQFSFKEGDVIKVTNKEIIDADKFYTFTYDGEKFVSKDAVPTKTAVRWYAYFPSNEVSLVGQSGKWEDIADKYVMSGSTPYGSGDVTGEDGLDITLEPKVAILKIINQKGSIDINVKTAEKAWVSGYKTSSLGITDPALSFFSSDTKQTLLSTTEKGTYYIAVPARQQLAVKNDDEVLKSTGESGLTAGKCYELVVEDYFKIKANKDPNSTNNYYATFYSSKAAYEVPTEAKAYAAKIDGDNLQLTDIGNIIHRGEPVILKATCSNFTLVSSDNNDAASTENDLVGTDVAIAELGANNYALSLGQNGVGFYLWKGKSLAANTVYLPVSSSAGAKSFTFQFDD
ncbi:MAG: hypothetical protein MJY90_08315 [Bacteroidaceae bacterium]|nr:hypothetical protein [Bacteroidaceae bacterium]